MPQASTAVVTVRKLHRSLLVWQLVLIALFVSVPKLTGGPVLQGRMAAAALLPAGIGLALIVVGMLVIRRRVPRRPASQSPEEFWAEPATRGQAVLFWVLLDGGTFMSALGYGLSGDFIPAVMAVVGLALLATYGPGRLADV